MLLPPKSDLLAVPLEDMKTISCLIKILVCLGIHPYIPDSIRPCRVETASPNLKKVEEVCLGLVQVMSNKDDISDIILMTPLADLFAGAALVSSQLLDKLTSLCPVYIVYRDLVGLLGSAPPLPAYKANLSHVLAMLPLRRSNAVRSLLEYFIGFRELENPRLDKLNNAVAVLASVPKDVEPREYVLAIGNQLYSILANPATPTPVVEATLAVVSQLDSLKPKCLFQLREKTLAPFLAPHHEDLENSLMCATNLMGIDTPFARHIGSRIAVLAFILCVSFTAKKKPNKSLMNLVVKLLDQGFSNEILHNLLANSVNHLGVLMTSDAEIGASTLAQLVQSDEEPSRDLNEMESRLDVLITALNRASDKTVSSLFVDTLKRWVASKSEDPHQLLLDAKLLTKMDSHLRTKLFSNLVEIADLCLAVVSSHGASRTTELEMGDSDDEDEPEDSDMLVLCLDLLAATLMEGFTDKDLLANVEKAKPALEKCTYSESSDVKSKAALCLELFESFMHGHEPKFGPVEVNLKDSQAVLALAHTSLKDPLIPVVAYGLRLVSDLLQRKDGTMSMEEALSIFLKHIANSESFIYLNCIKGIEGAAVSYTGNDVLAVIYPRYFDRTIDLDVRLRIGEALTRVIQVAGDTLGGPACGELVACLLELGGARGEQDIRLRSSGLAILGWICNLNPHAVSQAQQRSIVDIVCGVLTHERDQDHALTRRSAMVLLLEVVNGFERGAFLLDEMRSLRRVLEQATSDGDDIVQEYARDILSTLNG